MSKAAVLPAWQRAVIVMSGTVVAVVVFSCLYWAQAVFIPLALAIFLTFLLSPLVSALQRRWLGRVPAVLLVVTLATLLLGGVGWVGTHQVLSLVDELPQYTGNILDKIKSLRALTQGAGTGRVGRMIEEIVGEFKTKAANPAHAPILPTTPNARPAPEQPPAVVVQPESPAWLGRLPVALGPVVESLGGLALSTILVIFMLLKREDLRNRLIRLMGQGRITATTKAVDVAGQRISRFLLMQVIVNGTYGLALALGLFVLGVKHALLWGFLAAVLRYIPYLGAWIAAIPPVLLSLAMFEGWVQPLLVIGLIALIELVSNNVLEPQLYGQSMGVSEVALLVSAAFWALLWGPIGMVLSSPLTVCLVVLGKYVPQLEFLDVLLGDEPALDADVSYYQRLLARDQDEATQLVFKQVKAGPPELVYDTLLLPALTYIRRDSEHAELSQADVQFVYKATSEILEDLGERQVAGLVANGVERTGEVPEPPPPVRVAILGCPACDEADLLGLEMVRQLLDPAKWDMQVTAVETLTAELVTLVARKQPALICIGSLPPGGLAHTRYLCKKLRAAFPRAKIVVGRWGLKDNVETHEEQLKDAGADTMETTLLETRNHLNAWLPVLVQEGTEVRAVG